jgi:branched-chain amino acid transport system permease protein
MAATDTSAAAAHAMAEARARAVAFMARRHRFRAWEALPWLLAIAAFFLFPDRMAFGSQVLLMVLFTLSLDLILGFAGIVSLGHAAFFGLGAYTAALLTVRGGWEEQISGLAVAAAVAAIAGTASGWLLLRYRGLTLLVLTLSAAIMLQELGNVLRDITGGYDGLPGLTFKPLLGLFDYDLYGHVAYLYALAVLFVLFMLVRMIVHSPFGQTLAGIRENVARMHAIGSPVHLRLVVVYTIAAALAGVAGALFTQTNQYVTLGVFDFDNSAGVMVMLILGGTGRLYGAFVGAVIYMVLQDYVSKLKLTWCLPISRVNWCLDVDGPQYWQFAVGLLLVLTVLFARRGLLGLLEDAGKPFARERKP